MDPVTEVEKAKAIPSSTSSQPTLPVRRRPAACYLVGLLLPLCAAVAGGILVVVHLDVIHGLAKVPLLRAHVMGGAFGMLGATVAAMRKYYNVLITDVTEVPGGGFKTYSNWSIGWVYYYATRPVLGFILGALTFTLSFIGVQVLAKPADVDISKEGRYLLFGIAFLSGFAVSHVLNRLEALAREIFKSKSA